MILSAPKTPASKEMMRARQQLGRTKLARDLSRKLKTREREIHIHIYICVCVDGEREREIMSHGVSNGS